MFWKVSKKFKAQTVAKLLPQHFDHFSTDILLKMSCFY